MFCFTQRTARLGPESVLLMWTAFHRSDRLETPLPRSGLSGKAMARTGLRMMPTFPLPPLKFRTAGFPRYGFKAGLSDEAFPANWFAIVLRALHCHRDSLLCVRGDALISTSVRAVFPLYPGGPRSSPGYIVPVHPRLSDPIRPVAGTPGLHRSRLIPDAFAVHIRICLGDPRLVLSFR